MPNRIKLHVYPHAIPQDGGTPLFANVLPLSPTGIAKWCDLVEPDEAKYFYGGQFHDKNSELLVPERFEHLKGNERRHIFDVEGDWDDKDIPGWLSECVITARNALVGKHSTWAVYPTPGCSMLMLKILASDVKLLPPQKHGFQFRGQLDSRGTRLMLEDALRMADVPHSYEILGHWNLMGEGENEAFVSRMAEWSMALCPRAWGHFTMRFYEACALGRYPIVIGDNLWLDNDKAVRWTISPWGLTTRRLAKELWEIAAQMNLADYAILGARAKKYFDICVRPYYADPTAAFLTWLEGRQCV